MDFFENRYYNLNRKLLSFIGQWPYQEPREKFWRRSLIIIVLIPYFAALIGKHYTAAWDMDLFFKLIPQWITALCASEKYFNYYINEERLRILLDFIKYHWISLRDENEREIMKSTAEHSRLCVLCYVSCISALAFIFCVWLVLPIFLDIVTPLNVSRNSYYESAMTVFTKGQTQFYVAELYWFIILALALITFAATDILVVAFILHARALFILTGYRLQHVFTYDEESIALGDYWKCHRLYQRIGKSIECHNNAIFFTRFINETYGVSGLVTAVLGLINLSMSLYCVAVLVGKWKDMTMMATFVICQVGYLFIFMYFAQSVIDHSSAILHITYSGPWYYAPTRVQKLLLLIMQRSVNPYSVLMGKIVPMSLESGTTIVQSAVSYFMAFYSLR